MSWNMKLKFRDCSNNGTHKTKLRMHKNNQNNKIFDSQFSLSGWLHVGLCWHFKPVKDKFFSLLSCSVTAIFHTSLFSLKGNDMKYENLFFQTTRLNCVDVHKWCKLYTMLYILFHDRNQKIFFLHFYTNQLSRFAILLCPLTTHGNFIFCITIKFLQKEHFFTCVSNKI